MSDKTTTSDHGNDQTLGQRLDGLRTLISGFGMVLCGCAVYCLVVLLSDKAVELQGTASQVAQLLAGGGAAVLIGRGATEAWRRRAETSAGSGS